MRISLILVLVLLSSAVLLSQDSISLEVRLVPLTVSVTDMQGKSVTSLERSDFEILEDGAPQAIRDFGPADTPFNTLVLFDCSESTLDRSELLLEAMGRFVEQLRPSDRLEVVAFGTDVYVALDWKSDRRRTINFSESPLCRGTDFYGALEWSVKELRDVRGRRGVVVFSDGIQENIARRQVVVNGNKVRRIVPPADDKEFQKLLRKVRDAGAPFYFVAVDTDLNPGPGYAGPVADLQQIRARLEQLAGASGGRIVFPKETQEVVPMFLEIGRELGTSYSLTYRPAKAPDGKYHSIEVRVRGENLKVQQSRTGYTAN